MAFPSVYEMTNPLTTVRKQHFWEYFSGATLNSRWTQRNVTLTGTFGISDSVDDGMFISTNSSVTSIQHLDFNEIRPFSNVGSVFIGVAKRVTATSESAVRIGLWDLITDGTGNKALSMNRTDETNYKLETSNAGTQSSSNTDTPIPIDTNWHVHKIETSTPNVKLTMDGILEVTKTTDKPATNLMPVLQVAGWSGAGVRTMNCRYVECYNT